MTITLCPLDGLTAAVIETEAALIVDAQSALDLIANVRFSEASDIDALVLPKSALAEDFFRLRTGLAGEILQKFINYYMKLAIIGDFSGYTSEALRDFIRESNRGKDIFFAATRKEALALLQSARRP